MMKKADQDSTVSASGHKGEPLAYPDAFAEAVRRIYSDDENLTGKVFKTVNGWVVDPAKQSG